MTAAAVIAAAFMVLITCVSEGNLFIDDGEILGLGPLRSCVILWDDDPDSSFDDEDGEGDVEVSFRKKTI